MRAFANFITFLFVILLVIVGLCFIALSLQALQGDEVLALIDYINNSQRAKIALGGTGSFLILLSILVVHFTIGKIQRERTIAFANPDGEVTIALSAIEDFIKKVAKQMPEVKELKSDVIASKKCVEVSTRATLWSDTNIPDVTEKIQVIIRNKLQEMLGIEEKIEVKVHVGKIVHKEGSESKEPEIPYRGIEYR